MQLNDWLERLELQSITHQNLNDVIKVADKLGVRSFDASVVTVTGTNGKGSCIRFLSHTLCNAGYRVATFTSPHVLAFNERFRVNGKCLADEDICYAMSQVEQARGDTPLNYFSFITLSALLLFQSLDLDVIFLEVGLGGRLDPVNIIDCDLAIVTSIDLDHCDKLGDSREAIAAEKAGIMRDNIPVICGDDNPPLALHQQAEAKECQLYCRGQHFDYQQQADSWSWQCQDECYEALPMPHLPLASIATGLMALTILSQQFPVARKQVIASVAHAKLQGRFQQQRYRDRDIILDMAHNPAAANWLAEQLTPVAEAGRTLAVFAMLSDKDVSGVIENMRRSVDGWYIAAITSSPRAVSVAALQKQLSACEINDVNSGSDPIQAFEAALEAAQQGDRIVVFGSTLIVAEILDYIRGKN